MISSKRRIERSEMDSNHDLLTITRVWNQNPQTTASGHIEL